MATTLLLDRDAWDLAIDASGNIALASEPYSVVQDVASACQLFDGELWYDTTQGIPYFDQVFRGATPVQVLKAQLANAAEGVPLVRSARAVLTGLKQRAIGGQVQVTLTDGQALAVPLG